VGGATAGQLSFLKELLHKTEPAAAAPASREKVEEKIDELTRGYNQRMAELRKGIIPEESQAGGQSWTMERKPHEEAAGRLRADASAEQAYYEKAVQALRSLSKPTK
jgi:hypothetical protein